MNKTINFGIDLGTTNSAIAKYEDGEIVLFKNPLNLKQTLPSVVAFRKNRIVVGDKAREILQKDPANVIGGFKRKMGTSDTWKIPNLAEELNAEQLSAYVLKELKNFIHTGEIPDSVVITIPASFDTMQSNATKKAGYQAGFKEVVLLQEPIAASLAYANRGNSDLEEMKWLVYDLGGGTFDLALVSIEDDEMKVVDHEGNNYLGGTDFDKAIIEKLIIPELQRQGSFIDLENQMKSATGKYNRLYNLLLFKAEEAKIQLTNSTVAEIEFETEDDTGEELEIFFEITREKFNELIRPQLQTTIDLIQKVISRNHLDTKELSFVLMIGGSTYIPAVREQIGKYFGIEVNCNIDPTAAVAVGAAYYAGMKPIRFSQATETQYTGSKIEPSIKIQTAYAKATQDNMTPLLVRVEGAVEGLNYRITRNDGGFDSGIKKLQTQFTEYLTLAAGLHNEFSIKVYDEFNNPVSADCPTIGIMHGKFSIDGQPLPHDICLEVDATEEKTTVLEPIFRRNAVLPLKKSLVKEISQNIRAGSDDSLLINVVEGPLMSLASANKTIGFIKISGHDLERDLIRGSEVELTFEMSESRDLKVEVYLSMIDHEIVNVFSPSVTHIHKDSLLAEIQTLKKNLERKLKDLERKEDYSGAAEVAGLVQETNALAERLTALQADDVTDEKYQIDEEKRRIAGKIYTFFNTSVLQKAIEEYFEVKKNGRMFLVFNDLVTEQDKDQFENLIKDEKTVLRSDNLSVIRMKTRQIEGLLTRISSRKTMTNEDIINHFSYIRDQYFENKAKAEGLRVRGEKALSSGNYGELLDVTNQLYRLQKEEKDNSSNSFKSGGTGLK